ncbi:MAG: apolipoprotein acyltransferase, partial [Methylocystis sp.]
AQTSIAALLETNEKIRAELPTLLDTLGETNASLHAVIDTTGKNLVTLEHELGKRLAEFHGALNEASTQVEHISAVAGGTMQDANAIVAALDERQHTLSQSAEKLAQSQEALDAVMAARRRSLEDLVTLIEGRRAEFESAMTQFSELMDRSFRSIETRSRDLGGELSETSRQTADMIETRFAAVRAAAEGEREQTSEALRAAFSETNEEITRLFGDARSKFDAATDEIRGLARNIHREIEETREEVRRGATEIPRETAEQAAALRRVVGDQVKALNELTDIVARSGRVYDIAEQSAPPLRQPVVDQAVRAEPAAPRLAQNRTAEPTREPQGGWLSNLLARASFDDAAPQPPRQARSLATAGALDSLTLDIARMVDNAAVAELWRRYQRGEKGGLFGRRLYTAQGHQTFEEIRRRYRVDQAFRTTADRYVQHFEDLLIETSRGDHDGSKALDLLTGDAGKVYTMLSHASGRFE